MVGDPHRPICCHEVVSLLADIDRVLAKGQGLSRAIAYDFWQTGPGGGPETRHSIRPA